MASTTMIGSIVVALRAYPEIAPILAKMDGDFDNIHAFIDSLPDVERPSTRAFIYPPEHIRDRELRASIHTRIDALTKELAAHERAARKFKLEAILHSSTYHDEIHYCSAPATKHAPDVPDPHGVWERFIAAAPKQCCLVPEIKLFDKQIQHLTARIAYFNRFLKKPNETATLDKHKANETLIHTLLNIPDPQNKNIACPFHTDKHPSARIYSDPQRFHCYSCNLHLDSIAIYQRLYTCSFTTAVRALLTYSP